MSISLSTPTVAQAQSAASSKTASAGKGPSTPDNTFTQLVDEQIAVLDGKGKTDKTTVVDEADSKTGEPDGKDVRPDPATLAAMLGAPVLTEPVKPVVDTAVGEQVVAASDDGQADLRLTGRDEGAAVVAASGDSEESAAQAADRAAAAARNAQGQAPAPVQDGGKTVQDAAAQRAAATAAGRAAQPDTQGVAKATLDETAPVESKQPVDFGSELQAAARSGAATVASAATPQQAASALAHIANGGQTAPTAAAPAPLALQMQQPVTSPQWGQELGQHVALLAQHKLDGARLQMNPEKMGPIEVTLKFGAENQLTLNFVSAVPNTRDVLEQNLPRLAQQLAGQGIQLADAQVSSGQRDQQSASSFAQQGGQSSSGRGDGSFSLDGNAGAGVTTTVIQPATGKDDGRVSVFA
ncbi:flagellar hook-length control protein FliK [Microvirgula aerodenitrificans]|uniref:flagellar hook-length control protein FliK n=1 Tax=Microvirgula aerodenitrificans TaxID=57480 RepID=UPI0028EA91A9|nr:flagellar hook-length control protein FliK [Microvirgula aerodenitrificans]